MARKQFPVEQIIAMLHEAEVRLAQGQTIGVICKGLGVLEQSYYRWRREYGGLKLDQAKRLKDLERENEWLTVVDEFTRRCLAIVVAGKLRADDVLHCLSDSFAFHARREHIRSGKWTRICTQGGQELARPGRREHALHRARQPLGEWLQ